MLIEQKLDKLNAMKLGAMADAFQQQLQTGEAATRGFDGRFRSAVRRRMDGPRAAQAAAAPPHGQAAFPGVARSRRLQPSPAAQPPAGPDAGQPDRGDRGPRRARLDADRQPVAGDRLARRHRRPNQADAICDPLLHDTHRIDLKARSMRRTHDAPAHGRKETT